MPMKQIFDTALTDLWATASEKGDKAGEIRWEGNKCYKCVKFTATSAASGRAMKYADAAGYAAHEVRETTTATELTAGFNQAAIAAGDVNKFGWIQIKGPAVPAVAPSGSPAIGDGLQSSATLAALAIATSVDKQIGVFISATLVVLDCPQ